MVELTPTHGIAAVSLFGAACQAIVTIRWYEPPKIDDREPNPAFEAGIFFLLFGLVFVLVGFVLSAVAALVPPYSQFVSLVLVPVGGFAVYAALTGRLDAHATAAQARMGGVFGLVVAVYPVVFLVL